MHGPMNIKFKNGTSCSISGSFLLCLDISHDDRFSLITDNHALYSLRRYLNAVVDTAI